jgi:Uma2 family endonuclease
MSAAILPPVALPPPPAPLPAVPLRGIVINGRVRLPAITDHADFRAWARSDECPEKLRVAFLDGVLWVDLSMEQLFTHNQVKTEFTRVLGNLVRDLGAGRYLTDGMLLSHPQAGFSTIPDGLYVSFAAMQSGRVRRIANVRNVGAIELEGAPEMVLEVVSDNSVDKDNIDLPPLYYRAGIDEFWRADARGDLTFEIFRWRSTGYDLMRLPDGWCRSELFGRDFRLTQAADALGEPMYTLDVRV